MRNPLVLSSTFVVVAFGILTVSHAAQLQRAVVIRVHDGDTVSVSRSGGELSRVRLAGIDAPELSQPYGKHARIYLESLIGGKNVDLNCIKKDRYRRSVCQIFRHDEDLSLVMVRAGAAWWYRKYSFEQSVHDRVQFENAEAAARAAGSGLWAVSDSVAPWIWRSQRVRGDNAVER